MKNVQFDKNVFTKNEYIEKIIGVDKAIRMAGDDKKAIDRLAKLMINVVNDFKHYYGDNILSSCSEELGELSNSRYTQSLKADMTTSSCSELTTEEGSVTKKSSDQRPNSCIALDHSSSCSGFRGGKSEFR